jgi:hypothetical protein
MGEVTVVAVSFSRPLLVGTIFAVILVVVILMILVVVPSSGFCRLDPDVCRPDGDRPENWCLPTSPPVQSKLRPAEMNLRTDISACAHFLLKSEIPTFRSLPQLIIFRTDNGNTVQDCSSRSL